MKNLKRIIGPFFDGFREEKTTGKISFKISMTGNQEPIEDEISSELKNIAFEEGFIITRVSAIHDDDGFTQIFIDCYNAYYVMDHIGNLEKALNKAIIMLDDYNNMYGDKTNKSKEIIELDKALKGK